ncbi:hypothetical protein WOSG25_050660 [Weissella oryzae SG25]|uniref:Transposase n=1 Tax=Weissella oryzae (strain DSM 25784 / JCM 18191 / LMG 30913 / SG25) TaxID=1329250 RepID=A0A069CTL8_WEIOS|nr:helix-turn-helix domain-containing protein [Weissella oryzae]GAK30794.1 hypothetical protein WOSG25_050660 [Weissella oryzae SG25]
MTKHSGQEKKDVVHEYLEHHSTLTSLSKKHHISTELIKLYVAVYKGHGDIGLICPPKITPSLRLKITEWAIENDASSEKIAEYFGYTGFGTVSKWKAKYHKDGTDGLMRKQIGIKKEIMKSNKQVFQSNEVTKLKVENTRLKIQNEALKLLASMN